VTKVDLIVLGFPRRGGLTTRLFGSVTLLGVIDSDVRGLEASLTRV